MHKEEQASSITQINASISQLTEALKESLPAFQESCTIRFTSQSNKSDTIQVALSDLKSHVDEIQNQLQTLQERNPDKVMEGVKRYQEMLDQKLEEAMINVGLSYRKILACVEKKDFDIELAKVNDKYDKEIQVLKENIESLKMSNRRERTQSRHLNNSVTKKASEISPQRTRKQSYNIEMQQPDNTAPHKQHPEFAIVPQNFHIKTGESVEQSIGFQNNDLSASNSEPSINHRLSQIKEEEQLNPSIIASQNERVHSPMQNEALSIMRQSTQPLINEEPQICSSNQLTSHQYSKSKLHSLLSQDHQDPSQDSEHMDFVTKLEFERLLDDTHLSERVSQLQQEFSLRIESVEQKMIECEQKVTEISNSHGILSGFYHKKKREKSTLMCDMIQLRDKVGRLQGMLFKMFKGSLDKESSQDMEPEQEIKEFGAELKQIIKDAIGQQLATEDSKLTPINSCQKVKRKVVLNQLRQSLKIKPFEMQDPSITLPTIQSPTSDHQTISRNQDFTSRQHLQALNSQRYDNSSRNSSMINLLSPVVIVKSQQSTQSVSYRPKTQEGHRKKHKATIDNQIEYKNKTLVMNKVGLRQRHALDQQGLTHGKNLVDLMTRRLLEANSQY